MQRLMVAVAALILSAPAATADDGKDMERMRSRLIAFYSGQAESADEPAAATQDAAERLDAQVRQLLERTSATPEPSPDAPSAIPGQVADLYRAVLAMAQAYAAPASSFHQSPQLKDRIEAELARGYEWIKPGGERPGNWYPWMLGTPRVLGPALLLLEGHIDPQLHARHVEAMADLMGVPNLNGANAVWDSRNRFYLGLLRRDPAIIDTAWRFLLPELTIHSNSGILEDFSYHFHGDLLHTHGYGEGLADSAARLIYFSDGTRWSVSPERRAILGHHLVEHARWVIAGEGYDLSVKGRGVLNHRPPTRHTSALLLMAQLDSPVKDQVRDAAAELLGRQDWELPLELTALTGTVRDIKTQPLTGFRFFPKSDFAVHRAEDWYASVRMYSNRLIDYEGNWGQNESGWFLTYGLTYITRTRDEIYRDRAILREHWDWERLPGTTTRVGVHPPGAYNRGTSPFAGGAGDGISGLCAFILEPAAGDYVARKSVFFFDRGFAAAGDGIASTAQHAQPVVTTVTQWAAETTESPLVLSGDREVGAFEGEQQWENVQWAWFDGVGYVFPEPVTLHGRRRGPVLTLWLDHGSSPDDAGYSYIVLPNADYNETQRFAAEPSVRIVQRDAMAHAFHDERRGADGAVFWRAGAAGAITADGPAVVYVAPVDEGAVLAVQRPLHDPAELTVALEQPRRVGFIPTELQRGRDELVGMNPTLQLGAGLPPETRLRRGDAGELQITIPTVAGRVYRVGLGGARVAQPPRIEQHRWEPFAAEARTDGWTTDLLVTLPEPARDGNYRLQILGRQGHLRKELTDQDIVAQLDDGRVHYRWRREGENVRAGNFSLVLIGELHHVSRDFSVPESATAQPAAGVLNGKEQR